MRILGLDVGDKTIGVSLSDELLISANGITTIERVGSRKDANKILDLVREYNCKRIVIGLPLSFDGSDSIQTKKVREFSRLLENKMRSTGLHKVEVILYDERFTTLMAERVLIEADLSREKRKTVIDKQAAVIILQDYLNSILNEEH
ncbi:MAG: Holliday junction resolvase RuvX [Anaerovoracaceae bacterium]